MGGCESSGLTIESVPDPSSNGGSTGAAVTGGSSGTAGALVTTPPSGVFVPAGMMNVARAYHTATLLPDGRVLIAGGISDRNSGPSIIAQSAELYQER